MGLEREPKLMSAWLVRPSLRLGNLGAQAESADAVEGAEATETAALARRMDFQLSRKCYYSISRFRVNAIIAFPVFA